MFSDPLRDPIARLHEEWIDVDSQNTLEEIRSAVSKRFACVPSVVQATRFVGSKPDHAWLLWRETHLGPRLVDYQEFDGAPETANRCNFRFIDWLDRFRPSTFLGMASALELYRQNSIDGFRDKGRPLLSAYTLDLNLPHRPRVNACLYATNGILIWGDQLDDLLLLAGVTQARQRRTLKSYYIEWAELIWTAPGKHALQAFEDKLEPQFIDSSSLRDLISERARLGPLLLGRPDYAAVDRLLAG